MPWLAVVSFAAGVLAASAISAAAHPLVLPAECPPDCVDVNLAGARIANLHAADLRGADLRFADLRGAHLRGATLDGADLRGIDLAGAFLLDAS